MKKLPEVTIAKALMTEAMEWSVFKWLFEKRRVRGTADEANAALDKLERTVKSCWTIEVKTAYKRVSSKKAKTASPQQDETTVDPELELVVKKVRDADDAAERARLEAEETFDEAERQLNTDLAREGCRKAIRSWELRERAIRSAEAVPSHTKDTQETSPH
jgi:hypothetical protein